MPCRPGGGWVSAFVFRPFMQPDPPNLEVVVKFTAVHSGLPWVRSWLLVLSGGVGPFSVSQPMVGFFSVFLFVALFVFHERFWDYNRVFWYMF